ncbi:MAG TPA: glucoamylase family protein [Bryobacteraceae bacterium]|nr:glucoamylase family protein [Bryobacteraceae bacterium]
MVQTAHIIESQQPPAGGSNDRLRQAAEAAASWTVEPRPRSASEFLRRVRENRKRLKQLEKLLTSRSISKAEKEPRLVQFCASVRELRANFRLLRSAVASVDSRPQHVAGLPRVVLSGHRHEPRVAAVSAAFLRATEGEFSSVSFDLFVRALQEREQLTLDELWDFPAFLKFALFESILDEAEAELNDPESVPASFFSVRFDSLRLVASWDWQPLIEPLIGFDAILRQDPAGVYGRMDFESRELYRKRIAFIACRSDCSESQVAQAALDLARQETAHPELDERIRRRMIHVGYYIVEKGLPLLALRVGFHPPVSWRTRQFIVSRAEDFYIDSILVLTILVIAAAIFPVLPGAAHFIGIAIAILILLAPAAQVAVDLVNNGVTSLFDPKSLPKLDFSKGIPRDCATLVAVPSLLLNETQIRVLVNELEVRFLANRDPNLHYALLTDLPDSVSKPRENDSSPLVELASRLIEELNGKYRSNKNGAFILLHRRRHFNVRQGVWMGWERKRGKLLDLNKLLVGEYDAFPIKSGGIEALKEIRYILTLDADTQLPSGAAARLAGAIAHPLNQAVIDPHLRVVTSGYGILQPRMGVTVRSTARSRLAAIYSGQSGLDIYTHASSDPYQDLFGEGIFTGKGIYEVETLHAVLNRRFPRNAILSHDLIEGAYARAGLVTDIELVDDYPSHYSAYSRRQHRWLRGDWQIAQWMFARVPDESGRWAANPISDISRWKIFDNMRRSLVDPFLLILFVAGWLALPGGPLYWTIVPLLLLIFPSLVDLCIGLGRAVISGQVGRASSAMEAFWHSAFISLLHLVFLAHSTCFAIDAIVRALIRRFVTGDRLLEWETAAEAEVHIGGRTPVDRYLRLTPLVAVGIAALVWFASTQHWAIYCAAPILLLWALASPVTAWLNQPPSERVSIAAPDRELLLDHAVRIWRYFRQFGVERHSYLVPDNVQGEANEEAPRISPTNIGLLLNARQAACELGLLTVPEFAELTRHSLDTVVRLEKYRGHLYNWYDTTTLETLGGAPSGAAFVSSVDSGNMVASLFTLQAGAREVARRPLLSHSMFAGLRAYCRQMRSECRPPVPLSRLRLPSASAPLSAWAAWLPLARAAFEEAAAKPPRKKHDDWWMTEFGVRIDALLNLLRDYLPWAQAQFEPLRSLAQLGLNEETAALSISGALSFAETLDARLTRSWAELSRNATLASLGEQLREALPGAVRNLRALAVDLQAIADTSDRLAQETDFSFLVDPDRQVLSIGLDAGTGGILAACYDLLASEARVATFLAVARGDLPQQGWFKLARDHTFAFGRFILLSWTGTMFEYLMPSLWMRSYPATLIAQTQSACVAVQRAYAQSLGIPWGISESANVEKNDGGHYGYYAYGVPQVALSPEATAGPVISPYSTFLALGVDLPAALLNIRKMTKYGWLGAYGFYEAADYRESQRKPVLAHQWMAHHQGMSLLAIANVLCDNAVQRWFHANAIVQAAERLLHEAAVSKGVLKSRLYELAPLRAR